MPAAPSSSSRRRSSIFYAGWLGHYIGDGSRPLHDTVNFAGWIEKNNPHGYNTKGEIHHRLELVADNTIEDGSITTNQIRAQGKEPPRLLIDPFVDVLSYLKRENDHAEEVYKLDQAGAIQNSGNPVLRQFMAKRMAEGSTMLRDMIYTAWGDSANLSTPKREPATNILNQ